MANLEAPKNQLVSAVNAVVDTLVKGLGVEVAYALAIAQAPWLQLPIISSIFRYVLNLFAGSLDKNLKINLDIILIRYQNDAIKEEYDKAIEPLKDKGEVSDEELQKIKDSLDKLINRNR